MQKYNYSNKPPNKINKNLSKNDKFTQPELFANHLAAYDCMDFKSSEGQIIASELLKSLGIHVQITLQRLYVSLKCFLTLGGDAADGARALAFEGLLYFDVARCR